MWQQPRLMKQRGDNPTDNIYPGFFFPGDLDSVPCSCKVSREATLLKAEFGSTSPLIQRQKSWTLSFCYKCVC